MRLPTIFISLMFVPMLVFAKTIHVPGDYPTIQGGIDAAVSGDVVLVAPGYYVENLDFQGKGIVVTSGLGPDLTFVDGNQAGSVVIFQNQENNDAVLDGFTLWNGQSAKGAGINCVNASPQIRNNKIYNNVAKTIGGGIHCGENAEPIIDSNIIHNNTVGTATDLGLGGGIGCELASPNITLNTIFNNFATWGGGGIFCKYEAHPDSPDITGNIIYGNEVEKRGGGVYLYDCSLDLVNNYIYENTAPAGGGVCYGYYSSSIKNNIIYRNVATEQGGGLYCFNSSTLITNNTICENSAHDAGGGICCSYTSSPAISNTIFWNNTAPEGDEIWVGSSSEPSSLEVDYSNVKGGMNSVHVKPNCTLHWGLNMIDEDSLFQDPTEGDYHLTRFSPCINRGTNNGAPVMDIDDDSRPYMGTVDIGADEFTGIHLLTADKYVIYDLAGGTINFMLIGGKHNAGRTYIFLGGVTGTAPGTPLPGGLSILRINWDGFSNLVVALINSPVFFDFLGTLNAGGNATAQLNAPPIPGFAGVTMYYAYTLSDPFDLVSNPVLIEISQ